jgi:hypothetical protein
MTIKRSLVFCTLISFELLFVGCSAIIQGLYGIHDLKPLDDSKILRYSKKYGIPNEGNFKLDTAYLSLLNSFGQKKYFREIKNHYQPLQALYYDSSGYLISFQINCNAGGFPNLKWNRNGNFESFPPKLQTRPDSLIDLNTYLKYLMPISQASNSFKKDSRYTILIHWNRFMGRQSKRLIRIVKRNSKMADKKLNIIFINNDNFLSHMDLN